MILIKIHTKIHTKNYPQDYDMYDGDCYFNINSITVTPKTLRILFSLAVAGSDWQCVAAVGSGWKWVGVPYKRFWISFTPLVDHYISLQVRREARA